MLKHLIFAVFSLDRTHANFRRSEMDELYTSGNWVIGSQFDSHGYLIFHAGAGFFDRVST